MKNKALRFSVIIVLTVLLIGAIFYYQSLRVATSSAITIGTFSQAIDYAPFYVAKHFNWFVPQDNLSLKQKIKFKEFSNIGEIQSALAQEHLQVLFAAEVPIIKLVAQGNSLTINGLSCTLQQDILVKNTDRLSSIQQLKGKTVAVLDGTSSHYGLIKILEDNNLTQKDIKLVTGPPGEIKTAFEAGNINAWAVWPPFPQEQIIAGRGELLSGGEAKIQSVLAFDKSIRKYNSYAFTTILTALQKSKEWIILNPDEAIDIVAQTLKLDPEVVRLSWPKHNWSSSLDDFVVKKDIGEKIKFLQANGFANNNVPITINSLLAKT